MAIVIPIAVAFANSYVSIDPANAPLVIATLSSVLSGSIFGDHCSPISDTTIMSSMASGSDHIDHVKTQIPYAITGAGLAILGYLIVGFIPWNFSNEWLNILVGPIVAIIVGVVGVIGIVQIFGKSTAEEDLLEEEQEA